jgi:hypothetical protein
VGGDMSLMMPALVVGFVFAAIGVANLPQISKRWVFAWVSVIAVIYVGMGFFLHSHFQAKDAPPTPLVAKHSPEPMPVPEHPPVFKSQPLTIGTKENHKSYVPVPGGWNDQNKPAFAEVQPPKNIAKATSAKKPNVLSIFQFDSTMMAADAMVVALNIPINQQQDAWVFTKVIYDFNATGKYYLAYIPERPRKSEVLKFWLLNPRFPFELLEGNIGFEFRSGDAVIASWRLKFTETIYVYSETPFPVDETEQIREAFKKKGVTIFFRSNERAEAFWADLKAGSGKDISLFELKDTHPPTVTPVLR